MYQPKTTSFLGLLLVPFLLIFTFGFSSILLTFPLLHTEIGQGEVLDYSESPQIRFNYKETEYIAKSHGRTSCNNHPCNSIGDKKVVIINTLTPGESILLTDLLLALFFLFPPIIAAGIWTLLYRQSLKKKKIIEDLISRKSYTDAVIIDIETVRSRSKNRPSRIIGYKYICKDIQTSIEYDSDVIKENIFRIGNGVKVCHDDVLYPGIYWVDLNTVSETPIGNEFTEKHYENKSNQVQKDLYHDLKVKSLGPIGSAIITGFLSCLFFIVAIYFPGGAFILGLFGFFFLYFFFSSLRSFFQKRKHEYIKSRGIEYIGEIISIRKAGNWKSVPLGFIPENEKKQIDINEIQHGINVEYSNIAGYPYQLEISVNGSIKMTEKLTSPLSPKLKIGSKIRVFFADLSLQEFTTDIESVDGLN